MPAKNGTGSLTGIWQFLEKYFRAMPRWVQVSVYLLLVVYFIAASVRLFMPEAWDLLFDREQEIRGEVQGSDGSYLPVSAWLTEINGDKLYIRKKKIADDRFYYEWILKATPKEFRNKVHLNVSEFYQDPTNEHMRGSRYLFQVGFVPAELRQKSGDAPLVLRLDLDRRLLTTDVAAESGGSIGERKENVFTALVPSAYAQSKAPIKVLARDSAAVLLRDFRKLNDPFSDRDLKYLLPAAGSQVKIAVAESLKKAVSRGNKGAIADYAAVLTEYDSLFIFTSAGSASTIFTDRFYASAVTLLHTGNDYESRRMAWFLYKLQDARSLPHLFKEYSVAPTTRARKLCLYVLEAFASNGDPGVRKRVKDWLAATHREEKSKELLQAQSETLRKF
jgi:hypothetical protein